MNIDEIKALAEIMCQNSLTSVQVEEDGKKLCIEKQPASNSPVVVSKQELMVDSVNVVNSPNVEIVQSPMVGVFYASPSPDSDSYVKVGSKVKKGDVLCVIEAMKLLNDITADIDGEIIAICATNGEMVEYGQTLFKIA